MIRVPPLQSVQRRDHPRQPNPRASVPVRPEPLSVADVFGYTEDDDDEFVPTGMPSTPTGLSPSLSPIGRPTKRILSRSPSASSDIAIIEDFDNPFRVIFPDPVPTRRSPSPRAPSPPPKRPRGRPRKIKRVTPEPEEEPVPCINMWALVKSRPKQELTGKGRKKQTKMVTDPPVMRGTVKLSADATYDDFLALLASETIAHCDVNLLVRESLGFYFMKNNKKSGMEFPLASRSQFPTLIAKIKGIAAKDRDLTELVVTMLVPNKRKRNTSVPRWHADFSAEDDDAEPEPVFDLDALLGSAPRNIDEAIAPFISALESKYPIGGCPEHPDNHCYIWHKTGGALHFVLDGNRMKVWALAIKRKQATFDLHPLSSRFFLPKEAVNYAPPRAAALPAVGPSVATPPVPGRMPDMFPQFYGMPYAPWDMPYPSRYGRGHAAPYDMGVPPQTPRNHPREPLSSPPPPTMDLAEFCRNYDLDDGIYAALSDGRFRIGDKVKDLSELDFPGLTKCEWLRFKRVYERYSRGA